MSQELTALIDLLWKATKVSPNVQPDVEWLRGQELPDTDLTEAQMNHEDPTRPKRTLS